jgi:ComF family protein
VLAHLFAEICPACGGSSGAGFCGVCGFEPRRLAPACRICGLPQPVASCPKNADWSLDFLVAPFAYAPPLDRFVIALKYHGARPLGRALGLLLVAELAERHSVDALVPMPLHPHRLRTRGYNQAAEIARPIARALKAPLLVRGIRRTRPTPPQTGSSAELRRRNVANAFAVPRDVAGLRLAIIDDVVTTGATANALATALRDAGAASVGVWAVARTP